MSERITIVIETGNAAFNDAPASELANTLRKMADRMEVGGFLPLPKDSNGNVIGSVKVEQI